MAPPRIDQGYRYRELGYWTELARVLEAGGFDALFLADVLGVYDVYGASRDACGGRRRADPGQRPDVAPFRRWPR